MWLDNDAFRIRAFVPGIGTYWNVEFVDCDAAYLLRNGNPVIVTRMPNEWWLDADTELGWLTPLEIKLLSALSFSACSSNKGQWYRMHPASKATNFPIDAKISQVICAYEQIENADHEVSALNLQLGEKESMTDGAFRLDPEWISLQRAKNLYEKNRVWRFSCIKDSMCNA